MIKDPRLSKTEKSFNVGQNANKSSSGTKIKNHSSFISPNKLNQSTTSQKSFKLAQTLTPTSAQKRQLFKDELQQFITEELAFYTKKMQLLLVQKISYEVPLQVQNQESRIKKELNNLLSFRVNNIAKSLQT